MTYSNGKTCTYSNKACKIYFTIALALTVLGCAMSVYFQLNYFDYANNSWAHGTPAFTGVSYAVLFSAGCAAFFSLAFAVKKDTLSNTPMQGKNIMSRAVSVIFAIAFALPLTTQILLPKDRLSIDSLKAATLGAFRTLHSATLVLSLLVLLYFALHAFTGKKSPIASLAIIFFLAAYALRLYLDLGMLLSNPRRIISVVSACSLLLFMIYELRIYTGRGSRRMYYICGMCSLLIACTSGFSSAIYDIATENIEIQTVYFICEFVLGTYAGISVFSDIFLNKAHIILNSEGEVLSENSESSDEYYNTDEASQEAVFSSESNGEDISQAVAKEEAKEAPAQPEDEDKAQANEKSDNVINAPELPKEAAEILPEDLPVSEKELASMYSFLYKSVEGRISTSEGGEDEARELVKSKTLELLLNLFAENEGRHERIENLRALMNESGNNEEQA